MSKSKYESKLKHLMKMPVFTAIEARRAGIPSRMLSRFCKQGLIKRDELKI